MSASGRKQTVKYEEFRPSERPLLVKADIIQKHLMSCGGRSYFSGRCRACAIIDFTLKSKVTNELEETKLANGLGE
jgi:hypothetical protein